MAITIILMKSLNGNEVSHLRRELEVESELVGEGL